MAAYRDTSVRGSLLEDGENSGQAKISVTLKFPLFQELLGRHIRHDQGVLDSGLPAPVHHHPAGGGHRRRSSVRVQGRRRRKETLSRCCGSGSGLHPDSMESLDPDLDSQSGSGSRRAKMTHNNRKS